MERTLLQVGNTPAGNMLARYAQQCGFSVAKLVQEGAAANALFGVAPAWDGEKRLVTFTDDLHQTLRDACENADVLAWDDCYGSLGWLPQDAPTVPFVVELRATNREPGSWSEATLPAEAGFAYLTGHADGPPLPLPGGQAALLTGAHGWAALAAALYAAGDHPPAGQVHITIAAVEMLATFHQFALVDYEYNGRVRPRSGRRWSNNHPICTFPCRDGYVATCATTDDQFARFTIIFEAPELSADPRFATSTLRRANADAFDDLVIPKLMTMTREEITKLAGDNAVPIAPVYDPGEVLASPLSAKRGLWRTVDNKQLPELPRVSRTPGQPDARPAPHRSKARSPAGPLAGVRVVEFSKVWAGPLLGRLLADLGADVVRIEPPFGRGPRYVPKSAAVRPAIFPGDDPGERPWNRHGILNILNRNKSCMTVDIKKPQGHEIAERLCLAADIVFENNLPGALERAGLGYDALSRRNPGLIYGSLSGYGQSNEMSHYPAYGPVTEGAAGLTWWIRDDRFPEEPLPTAIGYPDIALATLGAASILSALLEREQTGLGGFLDFSQIDTTGFMLTELLYAWQDAPTVKRTPALARHSARALRMPGEDSWCFVAESGLQAATQMVAEAANHGLSPCNDCPEGDPAERVFLHSASLLGGLEHAAVMLRDNGFDCALARDAGEVYSSPELAHFWVWIDNPDIGRYRYDNSPFVIGGERNTPHSFPGMGEHNRTILRSWLGLSDSELEAFEAAGALMDQPPEVRA